MKPSLLIVGLGNKGKEYRYTRHNLGWLALDAISDAFSEGEWQEQKNFLAHTQEARINTFPVLLVKPDTYMNRSGESVSKLVNFYKLNPQTQVLILVDDIDIPLGTIRIRMKGSAGTHNGLKSIIQCLGQDVPRLKIGLGPKPNTDLANFVLSKISPTERTALEAVFETIPEQIVEFIFSQQN